MTLLVRGPLVILAVIVGGAIMSGPWMLFTLHPLLMTLAAIGMTEGTYRMQQRLTAGEKRIGLRWHRYLQTLALCTITSGFFVIYCNKVLNGKAHLTTWHGIIGLMATVLMLVQGLVGALLVYMPGLFGGQLKSRHYYRLHRVFGYGSLVAVWTATVLGLMSNWMLRYLPYSWIVWLLVALVLAGVCQRVSLTAIRI